MYQIEIIPHARKDLDQLKGKVFSRIKDEIISLSKNPRPYGVVKLTNQEGYRLRIGDYRILYRIDDKLKEVFIYRIKHRKEVYR